jgi:hypothetical protein
MPKTADSATPPHVAADDPAAELIPESWPPVDPLEPVTARRIPWLLAVPAALPALLLPRKTGPHLAASSWVGAYLAHVFWLLAGIGTLFALGVEDPQPQELSVATLFLVNPLTEVRHACAAVVLLFYSALNTWTDVAAVLLIAGVIEAAFWLLGLLLVPFVAAGEGPRRTYFRSVKLLLWASAFQALLAWFAPRLAIALDIFYEDMWSFALVMLLELWWLAIVFRLGGRYAGPKQGPRWERRQPRCEACGYSLVLLPVDGRCPECGEPVKDSLPANRRPPAFAARRGLLGRTVGFAQTTWAALFARRFAQHVAVWSHHRAARNYALLICTCIGLLGMITFFVSLVIVGEQPFRHFWHRDILPTAVLVGLGSGAGALAWTWLLGLRVSRFGFRDVADRVVVLCYSTAWLLVPVLLGIAGGWAAYSIVERWGPFGKFYIREIGTIDYDVAVWLFCLLPCAVTFLMSFLRVRVLLRYTRFANA